jgi:hypothetical protein
MTIVTIHRPDEAHLAEVVEVARKIGRVEVNVYYNGEIAYCLEGVHRVEAAKRLGIPLTLKQREWDEVVETDCEDAEGFENGRAAVSAIWEYAYGSGVEGGVYDDSDFASVELV